MFRFNLYANEKMANYSFNCLTLMWFIKNGTVIRKSDLVIANFHQGSSCETNCAFEYYLATLRIIRFNNVPVYKMFYLLVLFRQSINIRQMVLVGVHPLNVLLS